MDIPLPSENEFSWFPRVLVIGYGGSKGLLALGFLVPIEDSKLLQYVDTYCGVSIGAIICLLIIAGYSIREIIGEAIKLDIFKELFSFSIQTSIENGGFMSNEPIRKRLVQLIIDKFGNVPTLYGLYMRTGKSFVSVTLNATDESCVMMGPFTHPQISCVDAVLFSMNIPFVFYQLIHEGKTYVDGALANPYPIDYFDHGDTNILGIYMKTSVVPGATRINNIISSNNPLSIKDYTLKIVDSILDQRRLHIIQECSDNCKHVCLQSPIIDTLGYSLTNDDKAQMIIHSFNNGKMFIEQLKANIYRNPKIPDKLRYIYPRYYDIEDDDDIEILNNMNMT